MADEAVPLDDRGLAYGDGLFETILVRDGTPLLWEQHLARLAEGCRRLGLAYPDSARLAALPPSMGRGLHVLKLILTRGSGGRGYCAPATSEPRLLWKSAPFSPHPRRWQEGVQVRLCELRLGIQPRLAGLKHLNRLENVLARQEWDDDRIAEGLLCDTEDRLVETTSMNLFWLREGRFETPRLDRCGVAGTLRAALQEIMPIAEVSHGMEALGEAQALWLGNSVQGVWPVASVESADGMLLHTWNPSDHSRDFQNIANELLGYPRLD